MNHETAQVEGASPGVGGTRPARGVRARLNIACVCAWAVLIGGVLLPPHGAGIPVCPSKAITGVPCPGCGMTRSVSNWVRGDVTMAMRYHPFGWAALVVAGWYAIGPLLRPAFRQRVQRSPVVRTAAILFLFVFVGYGVVRAARWVAGDHTIVAGG